MDAGVKVGLLVLNGSGGSISNVCILIREAAQEKITAKSKSKYRLRLSFAMQ